MTEITSVGNIVKISQGLKKQNSKIVLAGGCFDVLHQGHTVFLQKAKTIGDKLIVLLESDEKVKSLKGVSRPIHNQYDRAKALSRLEIIDYIVMLPFLKTNAQYDQLVSNIRPDVIAVTAKDENIHHQRVAKLVGAKLETVTKVIGNYSTSSFTSQTPVK